MPSAATGMSRPVVRVRTATSSQVAPLPRSAWHSRPLTGSSIQPASGNAIKATLRDLTYLGAETRISLTTPGDVPLTLSMPTAELPQGLGVGDLVVEAGLMTREEVDKQLSPARLSGMEAITQAIPVVQTAENLVES